MELTLDTVYETWYIDLKGRVDISYPCVEVNGAGTSVDVYISNKEEKPADETEMTLESSDVSPVVTFYGKPKYVLFKANTGSPKIYENNLVKP